jgi:hypothetical protein
MVGKALIFPVRDPNVISKCWWVPLVNLVPFFNFPIMLGWKINIARRLGVEATTPLPESRDFGLFLAEGVMVKLFSLVYYVPLIVMMTLSGSKVFDTIASLLRVIYENLFEAHPNSSFLPLLSRIVLNLLVELMLPTLYTFGMWPLFHAGLVRYLSEGRKRVFFDLIGNGRLLYQNGRHFLLAFFADYTARIVLLIIISPLLAATFLGAFATPFIIWPIYYAFTGHILGQLTQEVLVSERSLRVSLRATLPAPRRQAPPAGERKSASP